MNLNSDVLTVIFGYCDSKTSYNFALCCKKIYESTLKIGFSKHISFDNSQHDDIGLFIKRFVSHYKSINVCTIYNMTNPFIWMPMWVKKVYFYNCKINTEINPNKKTITEKLHLNNYGDSMLIKIKWEKFPLLKEIYIDNFSVNFEGIEKYCHKLKKITYFPRGNSKIMLLESAKKVVNNLRQNNIIVTIG